MSVIELQARRVEFQAERTATQLRYDGKDFGWIVEDPDRGLSQGMTAAELAALKVKGRTCIAAGLWPIVLRDSPKYGPDTLTILVQGHQLVRIHPGNDEDDTEGCLCPGLGLVRGPRGEALRTERSGPAVEWLEKQLAPHLRAGREAWIRIERDPKAWATAPFNPRRIAA